MFSDTLKNAMSYSALALALSATFSLSAHADEAWQQDCGSAKTANNCQLPFHQGLAAVLLGSTHDAKGLWGFIEPSGRIAINPAFSQVNSFVNGLAAAKKNDLYGYIDTKGNWVIEPRFSRATDFNSQGTALVVTDNRLALVDRKGAIIKTLPFAASLDSTGFVNGQPLASVQVQVSPALWDAATGRSLALPDDVMNIEQPQSGLIPAQKRDSANSGYWGYLDDNGEWAIDPIKLKTRDLPILNGDVVAVKNKNGWAFFDKLGVSLNKEQYKSVRPLGSGSWVVTDSNNNQQLLDSKLSKIQDIPADLTDNWQSWGDWHIAHSPKGVVMIGTGNQIITLKVNKPSFLQQGDHLWVMQAANDKSLELVQIYDNNGVGLLTDATLKALHDYKIQPLASVLSTSNIAKLTSSNSQSTLNNSQPEANQPQPETTVQLPWAILTPIDAKKAPAILNAQGAIFSDPQWLAIDTDVHQAPLLVHTENSMTGAIDANGQWVIQPQFKTIAPFDGNYTWATQVENNTQTSRLIDRSGNVVDVPTRILQTSQAISGHVLLTAEGENNARRWGLWDIRSKSAKTVPSLTDIEPFKQGYALAKSAAGWGVLQENGDWAIAPDIARTGKPESVGAGIFVIADNEPQSASDKANARYHLFDAASGQIISPDLLDKPQNVGDDHWLVSPTSGGTALLDSDGRAVLSKPIVPSTTLIKGNRVLLKFGAQYGAIDSQGEWQIHPLYSSELDFVAPLNWASVVSDKRIALIDDRGAEPLPDMDNAQPLASMPLITMNDDTTSETVLYDADAQEIQRYPGLSSIIASQASEDRVPLRGDNGLYGFIDAKGKKVIGPYFNRVGALKDGRAQAVKQDNYGSLVGYIDTTGRYVIAPGYDWGSDFSEKRAWVSAKGQIQLINQEGAIQAKVVVRCNQRIVIGADNHPLWPAKVPTCAAAPAGGNQ